LANTGLKVFTAVGLTRRRSLYLIGLLLLVPLCMLLSYPVYGYILQLLWTTPPSVNQVALADLNGNGYLDAFLVVGHGSHPYPAYVLYNDGAGNFAEDALPVGNWTGFSVALGDVNDDGHTDALLDITAGGIVVYLNDGQGNVREYGYLAGAAPDPKGVMRLRPVVADLNGDGRLDIFAAGCCGREAVINPTRRGTLLPYSQVWLHTSDNFQAPAQRVGQMGSNAVALADLNGDGSPDAFLANGRTLDAAEVSHPETPNTVWFNDGQGHFSDSGQQLGRVESMAVAVGDVNGDGFPDAVVGNRGPDEVWFNDGLGNFEDSNQRLGDDLTQFVFLADLNGDGHLDLFASGDTDGRAWFNDGSSQFTAGRQRIRYRHDDAASLGDVTGDGLIDVFVGGVDSYQVWRNDGNGHFSADRRTNYR
jgi:hypothetical protein